jgi:hypothetical protein
VPLGQHSLREALLIGQRHTHGLGLLNGARTTAMQCLAALEQLWLFGQLIASTNMHGGNLAFRPGLRLGPVFDIRGVCTDARGRAAAQGIRAGAAGAGTAASLAQRSPLSRVVLASSQPASQDRSISQDFCTTCAQSAGKVRTALARL